MRVYPSVSLDWLSVSSLPRYWRFKVEVFARLVDFFGVER
jgi:hypothetical protein